jgi:hypothetical protein
MVVPHLAAPPISLLVAFGWLQLSQKYSEALLSMLGKSAQRLKRLNILIQQP